MQILACPHWILFSISISVLLSSVSLPLSPPKHFPLSLLSPISIFGTWERELARSSAGAGTCASSAELVTVAVSCALNGASRGGMSTRTRHSGSWLSPLQYLEPTSAAERVPTGAGDPGHQRVAIREGVDPQFARAHGMQVQGDGLIDMYQS
jgi:hypothetical protein